MTVVHDLLATAELQVRQALGPIPELGQNRRGVAREVLEQQKAAWPLLAGSLAHAITASLPPSAPSREVRTVVLPLLAEIQALPAPEEVPPLPDFVAAAQAVGAAGDAALVKQMSDIEVVGRLLTVLQQAATVTAVYTEAAALTSGLWRRVAASAEYAAHADWALGGNARGPLPDPGEGTLADVLDVWGKAVVDILDHPAAHSQTWGAIALRFGAIAAAHDTVTGEPSPVPSAWRDASQAWPRYVQRVGTPHEGFDDATTALDGALRAAVTDPSPADRDALRHAVQVILPRLGRHFESATDRLLHAQIPFVAARALAREPSPLAFEHLHAVRRGGWVPLPRASHTATTIRHATSYATATTQAQATRRAATLTRAEVAALAHDQVPLAPSPSPRVTSLASARETPAPAPQVTP